MKISSIQPNMFNRTVFMAEEAKPENKPEENQGLDKNTKITAGVVTAAVALAGLGYLGYKGKLGSKIQKFLGGAKDAAGEVKPKPDTEKPSPDTLGGVKPEPNKENLNTTQSLGEGAPSGSSKLNEEANANSSEVKPEITTAPEPDIPPVKPEILPADNSYRFLTAEEFVKLEPEEAVKRVGADIEEIEKNAASPEEAFDNMQKYMERYQFDEDSEVQDSVMDMYFNKLLTKYKDVVQQKQSPEALNVLRLFIGGHYCEKGDFKTAEKYLTDIVNDNEMRESKLGAYSALKAIADAQGTPEKAAKIFDEGVAKDIQTFQEEQNRFDKLVENFVNKKGDITAEEDDVLKAGYEQYTDKKDFLNNIAYQLNDIYGAENPTIQKVTAKTKQIDEFLESIEIITSRYDDTIKYQQMP